MIRKSGFFIQCKEYSEIHVIKFSRNYTRTCMFVQIKHQAIEVLNLIEKYSFEILNISLSKMFCDFTIRNLIFGRNKYLPTK